MNGSSRIRYVIILGVANTLIVFVAVAVAAMIAGAKVAPHLPALAGWSVAVSLLMMGALFLFRLFSGIGTFQGDSAKKLAEELIRARQGKMDLPWDDIELTVNGESKLIPLGEVYERLVTVLIEANRMSGLLNSLAHEILGQAVRLSQSAEDQSSAVGQSTASINRIDTSIREVVSNVEDLADLNDNVSSATLEMITSIEEVGRNAVNLNQAVQEEVSAIEEMVGNIHTVADSTDSLTQAAVQSRTSMEEISRATHSIRDRAEEATKLSEAARDGAALTKGLLAKTVSGIHKLADTVEDTRHVMRQLGIQSRSIGEILNVITSVAADTHLLSLNASIMAAKAGEHGRGFSVVAQEIKTLANRTSESAKEIEKLILETQESVDKAVRSIEEGTARVGEGMRLAEEADHSLADVLSRAEVAAHNAHDIASNTEAQAAVSEQVFKAVDEVAKRTELIRAAMREQEDASGYVRERAVRTQNLVAQVAQAMSEQAESSRRISSAMERLTSRIQGIRHATEEQAGSSSGVVHAVEAIRKKADLVAISAQNVNNTSMSVLHQSILLRHELKDITLPERQAAVTIGLLFDNLREERWQREEGIFKQKAAELGAALEFRVAGGDSDRQLEQGEELVKKGVDLMIIVAVNAEAAGRIAESSRKAGIPVICYDRLIKNCELDLFVSFDANRIGEVQAETAVQKAPGRNILILAGSPTDTNSHMLHAGQMRVLGPLAQKKQIAIVDDIWVPDWSPEQAYNLTKRVIQTKGPIDAVVASNDGTAGGAIRAVKELIKDKKVVVTGMDTELSACRRIVEGSQAMTMYMPIKLQAGRAMEAAMLMLKKEEIPGITSFVDNGKMKVPAILLKPIKVDLENLEEVVVKDGFHKAEDVFK
ncbi:MAG TPA: substrate-binding domain-containing protein [bacterium]|nr:substrate-binding domain-containing protein [bacterium]